jgi:HEAT repeat protein
VEPLFGLVPLLSVTVAVLAVSIAYLFTSERRRTHLRTWRHAALQAGLTAVREAQGGLFEGGAVTGRADGLQVRLERYIDPGEHGTRIVVTGLSHGLSLRGEGLSTALEKRLVGEGETGDPSFDREYHLLGEAPIAVALLDSETRQRLAHLIRGPGHETMGVDGSLGDGVLEVRVRESGRSRSSERLPEVLAHVLQVARRLFVPPDIAARIAENLRAEPEAGVRLRGVLMLSREFPDHPAAREALLAACKDASEEVRLRAATALGEEGRETLLGLVEGAHTEDSCAARAIAALGDRLPAERVEASLRLALREAGRRLTALACLEALGRLGRAEHESLLLQALPSEDPAVSVAAVRALGRAGTVAAVAALQEAAERGGDLRGAARQAIAEIQARATGAEPGQLSLAGGEAGAVSLADGEPGTLSLSEEEEPRPAARKRERGRLPN